jgi:hypothetical protein
LNWREEGLLFVNKKKQKNFVDFGHGIGLRRSHDHAKRSKSLFGSFSSEKEHSSPR